MNEQKNKARKSWSGSGDKASDEVWLKLKRERRRNKFFRI